MKEYQRIKMKNDKYISDGIFRDAIGYIINIYDDKYCEVEFSNETGETYALQAICVDDFIILDD